MYSCQQVKTAEDKVDMVSSKAEFKNLLHWSRCISAEAGKTWRYNQSSTMQAVVSHSHASIYQTTLKNNLDSHKNAVKKTTNTRPDHLMKKLLSLKVNSNRTKNKTTTKLKTVQKLINSSCSFPVARNSSIKAEQVYLDYFECSIANSVNDITGTRPVIFSPHLIKTSDETSDEDDFYMWPIQTAQKVCTNQTAINQCNVG